MPEPVSVVLVGLGGYGEVYLNALLDQAQGRRCHLVGAVDPKPERCERLEQLRADSVPLFDSLDDFYSTRRADLAVISSPIQHHAPQTCLALENGSNVLVEKPAAASPEEVDRMIVMRDKTDRFVAVGYQWSFSGSILKLKTDIMAGDFGAPKEGASLTLWPRTEAYYARNSWAGKIRDDDGRLVLDSPANNAMAHFLHNLLFLLGDKMDGSANPKSAKAFLGRANDIETFDSVAATIRTENNVDLLFLASHAIDEKQSMEPRFKLEFENATVEFAGEDAPIVARLSDGTKREYLSPNRSDQMRKLWACVDGVVRRRKKAEGGAGSGEQGADENAECRVQNAERKLVQQSTGIGNRETGIVVPCGLEAARPHAVCIQKIHELDTKVHDFSADEMNNSETDAGRLRWVKGLGEKMKEAYKNGDWRLESGEW